MNSTAQAARLEEVDIWLENLVWPGVNADVETEQRLCRAFKAVLERMPEADFRVFMDVDPIVVCQEGCYACVFSVGRLISPDTQQAHLPIIYFAPGLSKRSEKGLLSTVAHEIAHVVLEHHLPPNNGCGQHATIEENADRLSQSWGFKPRYSAKRLAKMRAEEHG